MRVGIVEIMDTGHIVLAETLCSIFCTRPENHVYLFINEKHTENLKHLENSHTNLTLVVKPSNKPVEEFLGEITSLKLDRVYIVTLIRFFREISAWKTDSKLFLVIHNLDEWFGISFFEGFRKYIYSVSRNFNLNNAIYFFKVHFIYSFYKKLIIKKIRNTQGHIVVLSESVKQVVERLYTKIPVDVVPFTVFDPLLINNESNNDVLRICIPGILSQYRRDYTGFMEIVKTELKDYKNSFIIDFLGGSLSDSPLDASRLIVSKIEELRSEGFNIIYYPVYFIPPLAYDAELAKADIILGNMNVVLSKYSSYGITKETGLPFAMIKAAKPGILPSDYQFPKELSTSILLYKDLNHLSEILIKLINDKGAISDLKMKAIKNSEHFRPEKIYDKLIRNN